MKIAILGNGRMGKRISELAIERGYTIVCNSSSEKPATSLNLSTADVAIDFSTPTTAFENISHAINTTTKDIYIPVLKELEENGINFVEELV